MRWPLNTSPRMIKLFNDKFWDRILFRFIFFLKLRHITVKHDIWTRVGWWWQIKMWLSGTISNDTVHDTNYIHEPWEDIRGYGVTVVWVVQFLREGYKIRKVSGQKYTSFKEIILSCEVSKIKHYFREKIASKIEVIKSVIWKKIDCKFIYLVQCKK